TPRVQLREHFRPVLRPSQRQTGCVRLVVTGCETALGGVFALGLVLSGDGRGEVAAVLVHGTVEPTGRRGLNLRHRAGGRVRDRGEEVVLLEVHVVGAVRRSEEAGALVLLDVDVHVRSAARLVLVLRDRTGAGRGGGER